MAQLLKDAITNSARKGYHKRGMGFSRIHQSGTSKLLAKGDITVLQIQCAGLSFRITGLLTAQCIWTQVVSCTQERS